MKPIHTTKELFSISPGMKRTTKNLNPYSKSSVIRGITSTKTFPKKIQDDESYDIYKDCKNHHDMFKQYNDLTKSYYSIE